MRCLWIFKTSTFVSVSISVMIPVDRVGWNAWNWFYALSYMRVFVVFVCRLMSHLRIFCIYGGVTIVLKSRNIYSDARLSSHSSKDGSFSCIFIAFCDEIQMTVSIKSPCINKGY